MGLEEDEKDQKDEDGIENIPTEEGAEEKGIT